MLLKKLFAPMMMVALAGLTACGPSEPENNNPVTPPVTGGEQQPVVTPPVTSAYPALGSGANVIFPTNLYPTWNSAHFVTKEAESVYYASVAPEFEYVFPTGMYEPAGRVMWNVQGTTSYYANQCYVPESTVPGMKRRACTVSEGTGYGMLIAYFAGDVDTYNRIWNYSRAFRAYNNQNLTPWITSTFLYNVIDNSSATDADLDIATSLILMYYKYQIPAYLEDALKIIYAIWDEEVNKTSLLLYSGNTSMWNGTVGEPVYNLSYFSPVALRLFAMVDQAHNWTGVLDAMYNYIALVQASGTGVVPDWSNAAGLPVDPNNGSAKKTFWTFNKEAVRVPWRIAWDYYWFQDPRAYQVLKILNDFIVTKSAGDPSSTMLAYNYSANLAVGADITGSTIQVHWAGAWCLTGMGTNPAWLNACTDAFNQRTMSASSSSYFLDILQMSMSQLLNGLYIRPF